MTSIESVPVVPPPPEGMTYAAADAPLDEKYFELIDPASREFLVEQTGLKDPEELKQHVLRVQKEAYDIHPYPCVRRFGFARLKIARLPAYQDLLRLGRERKGALFLEIGCCVGNDTRRAVADGFPAMQVIASDLHPEFWDIGHKLFKDTAETFPVPFVSGDAFDDAFLAPAPIATAPPPGAPPALSGLTSLTPLTGRLAVIHASWFFHLFSEEKQRELAHRFAGLLSPEPGSLIFGVHIARPERGFRVEALGPNSHGICMFCHSPESWKALWEEEVFEKGQVRAKAQLVEIERDDPLFVTGAKFYMMVWSVTRLGDGDISVESTPDAPLVQPEASTAGFKF